jgi:flagellar FliL protein
MAAPPNRVETPASAGAAAAPASGGIKAWLPLIIAIVGMPVLAFVTTKFILIPQLQASLSAGAAAASEAHGGEPATKGGGEKGKSGGKEGLEKAKQKVVLSKVMVNISGSVGTRYLLGSYTLIGTTLDFEAKVKDHQDQLIDLAQGIMGSKTISDLEKPGARNLIRNELISAFNNALGGNLIKEIYITEFAIQ